VQRRSWVKDNWLLYLEGPDPKPVTGKKSGFVKGLKIPGLKKTEWYN